MNILPDSLYALGRIDFVGMMEAYDFDRNGLRMPVYQLPGTIWFAAGRLSVALDPAEYRYPNDFTRNWRTHRYRAVRIDFRALSGADAERVGLRNDHQIFHPSVEIEASTEFDSWHSRPGPIRDYERRSFDNYRLRTQRGRYKRGNAYKPETPPDKRVSYTVPASLCVLYSHLFVYVFGDQPAPPWIRSRWETHPYAYRSMPLESAANFFEEYVSRKGW